MYLLFILLILNSFVQIIIYEKSYLLKPRVRLFSLIIYVVYYFNWNIL